MKKLLWTTSVVQGGSDFPTSSFAVRCVHACTYTCKDERGQRGVYVQRKRLVEGAIAICSPLSDEMAVSAVPAR